MSTKSNDRKVMCGATGLGRTPAGLSAFHDMMREAMRRGGGILLVDTRLDPPAIKDGETSVTSTYHTGNCPRG